MKIKKKNKDIVHVYDCPICGYPVGFYRNEETGTLTGRCNVCGHEKEIVKRQGVNV